MKSLTERLWCEVPNRRGFINITPKIEELVQRSGVTEGLCLVNAMHITASIFINDDEPGLHNDYEVWLERLRTLRRAPIDTIGQAKTTQTPISSARSWAVKSWSRLPRANSISDRGNKSSTANSMEDGANAYSSK